MREEHGLGLRVIGDRMGSLITYELHECTKKNKVGEMSVKT